MTASRALARRLGVLTALCATVLTLGAVLHAAPASAYGNCLVFEDYMVTDTAGNTYMQSDCLIELGGMSGGSGTGGSGHGGGSGGGGGTGTGDGSGDGSEAPPVTITPPSPDLDPECNTPIRSNIDVALATGVHSNPGFPASEFIASPTIVYVTLDPNLKDGNFASTPWLQEAGLALGYWQDGLNDNYVGVKFLIDPEPATEADARAAMDSANASGHRQYHWHIRAARPTEASELDGVLADTKTKAVDLDSTGHSEFVTTRISDGSWGRNSADVIAAILAHEAGHSLGLADMPDSTTTSIMRESLGSLRRPTCSDFRGSRRAGLQDPGTGELPGPGPGSDGGGDGKGD